jgi:hypothetical protein
MTTYRRGIAVKFMYYIEIHGIQAAPDAPLARFYERLRGFYERLAGPCE